jgi:nucleoid-associated protein YgaU
MTLDGDRGVGRPMVCPFVAFADDRDFRADQPDNRHRCYAEPRPAPRALAHQARFCLSPGFTSCPTFQDWAVREAARVPDAALAGMAARPDAGELFDDESTRQPADEPTQEPMFAAAGMPPGIAAADVSPPDRLADGSDEPPEVDELRDEDLAPGAGFAAATRGTSDWDRPRSRRDYPRLERSQRVPRVLIGLLVLAAAAVLVFLLPSLITAMFGGQQAVASATPSGSAAASATGGAIASPGQPTAEPSPTPLTYVVQKGDTLTKIAKKFNVTVTEILAANPSITNANTITVGQVIVIPTAGASPSSAASP